MNGRECGCGIEVTIMANHVEEVKAYVTDRHPTMVIASTSDNGIRIKPPIHTHDFDEFLSVVARFGNPSVSLFADNMDGSPCHIVELTWSSSGKPVAVVPTTTLGSPTVTAIALVIIAVSVLLTNYSVISNTIESLIDGL